MIRKLAIVGGGPAGLMAAEEVLSAASAQSVEVHVFDAMPSVGRKFLMAGRGGMNITHSEPLPDFVQRYGQRQAELASLLANFTPDDLRGWMAGLGIESFIGSSGRVFPKEMKAAPLLRAWLRRLRTLGAQFHVRHRWLGWNEAGELCFATPEGELTLAVDACILALGGGSWAKLGSDGRWVEILSPRGIDIAPLQPANCGFDVAWSEFFRSRYAGAPLKAVRGRCGDCELPGEFNITEYGIEGGLIYALSSVLRDTLSRTGAVNLLLDLAPGRTEARLQTELARPRGRDSMANHLRRRAGLEGVKVALLHEFCPPEIFADPVRLAGKIKGLPVPLRSPRPIDEAISSAGGIRFESLGPGLMLRNQPGVFCAGEMLDWEAPTGGYLLTACLASGLAAGRGVLAWLAQDASV